MMNRATEFLEAVFPVINEETTIESLGVDIYNEIRLLCYAWKVLLCEGAIPTKTVKMKNKFGSWCDTFVIATGTETLKDILRLSYSPSALLTVLNRLNCTTANSVIKNGVRETPVSFFEENFDKMVDIMKVKLMEKHGYDETTVEEAKRIHKLQILEDMFYEITKVVGPFPIGKALIWPQMMYNQIKDRVERREITIEEIVAHMKLLDVCAGWGCRMFASMLFQSFIADQLEIAGYNDADIERFRNMNCYEAFDTNESMKHNYEFQKNLYMKEFSLGSDCARIHIMSCNSPEAFAIIAKSTEENNGGTVSTSTPTPQEIYANSIENLNPDDSYRKYYVGAKRWVEDFLLPLIHKLFELGVTRWIDAVDGFTEEDPKRPGKRRFVQVVEKIQAEFPDAKTVMYVGSTAFESCEAKEGCKACRPRQSRCGKCRSCRKFIEKPFCRCGNKRCRFCMANPKPTICYENACDNNCKKTQILRTIVVIDRNRATE